jgi:hypothetical protein
LPASSRAEWVARFCCAKQAAAKASGLELAGGSATAQVVGACDESGVIDVQLETERVTAESDETCNNYLRVVSGRRGHRAWAWTIERGIKP